MMLTMLRVSLVLRVTCAAIVMAAFAIGTPDFAWAAKKTTFAKGPISVRLCPARCLEVKRHPYKTGGTATVYETRGGWARVSEHIDPARLKAFGGNIPAKPAFWVRTRQLADPNISVASTAAPKDAEGPEQKKAAAKKKAKPRRFVQRRKVTLPRFRPDVPVQMAVLVDAEKPETGSSETVVQEPVKPIAEVPATVTTAPEGEKKEQRLVPQQPEAVKPEAEPKNVAKAVEPTTEQPPVETAAKPKPENKVSYRIPKAEEKVVQSEVDKAAAAKPVVKGAQTLTAADKFAAPAQTETAKKETVVEEAKAVVPAPDEQAENRLAKETPAPVEAKPAEEVTVAAVQPKLEIGDVTPLATDERPKTYTKALRDKRLRKLPGSKDKRFKIEEVIALRHHALMLLKNKECGSIAGGGRSVGQPGMLFIVCQEDPTYMRQFPLEEQTW